MCPIYMSYGMSYHDFWYGDVYETQFYRKAYDLKLKQQDENNWMQGMYVYDALCRVAPILHAFSKKGTKPLQYMEKPLLNNAINTSQNFEEDIEREQENERLRAIIHFNNWFRATKKQFEKK